MVHSERSEIIIPKSTTLGIIIQQQQKLFSIFLPSINPDVHVNKQKQFIKRVLGHERPPPLPEAKILFFLKINKMEAFPLRYEIFIYFFTFWQCSLNPQNNELAPQIP